MVPWREARRFFAWRLKRRLTEEGLIRHISSTDVSISRLDAIAMVRGWSLAGQQDVCMHSRACGSYGCAWRARACSGFGGIARGFHATPRQTLNLCCCALALLLLLQVRAWSSQAGTGLHDELALSSQAGCDDVAPPSRPLDSSSSGAPAIATAAAAEAAAAAAGDVEKLWEAMLESDKCV